MDNLQDEFNAFLAEVADLDRPIEDTIEEELMDSFPESDVVPVTSSFVSAAIPTPKKEKEVVESSSEDGFDNLDFTPKYLPHESELSTSSGYKYIIIQGVKYFAYYSTSDIAYLFTHLGGMYMTSRYVSKSSIGGGYRIIDQTAAGKLWTFYHTQFLSDVVIVQKEETDRQKLIYSFAKDTLVEMESVLSDFYGKENYDIIEVTTDSIKYDFVKWFSRNVTATVKYLVVVKYPEIKITNRDFFINKKFHIIRDLYAIIGFTESFKGIGSLQGMRGTLTSSEVFSNYRHSHTQKQSDYNHPFSFCIGSVGNDIYDNIKKLYSRGYSKELFIETLLSLDSHVAYESLEGTPYVQFKEIVGNKLSPFNTQYVYDKYSDIALVNATKDVVEFKLSGGNIIVNESSKIDDVLSKSFTDMLVYKQNNQYYKKSSIESARSLKSFTPVYFKGQVIDTSVISTNESEGEAIVHPEFKKHVVDVINGKIKNILINI